MKHLRIVGAGWAGLAAAVAAVQEGWQVDLYDTAHAPGGRARGLKQQFAGQALDNGQHVLIGAYQDTLNLMRTVGIEPMGLLQRIPLNLQYADGQGIALPDLAAPWNVVLGILRAKGWNRSDKGRLLAACWHWQRSGFSCDASWTVSQLCAHNALTPRVLQQLIEPLCLSALNTPSTQASASVFLRVLHDALMGVKGSADLLIPTTDLSTLFPDACVRWLLDQGANVHLGHRITVSDLSSRSLQPNTDCPVVLACPASVSYTHLTLPTTSRV